MQPDSIHIYRMTHLDNIPDILQQGIAHRNSQKANKSYITIGDTSLIRNRMNKRVMVNNGDYESLGNLSICLGDFIPFYFGVKMPMLYVIQSGGNFVEKATHPSQIVYVVCSLMKLVRAGHRIFFSDGHATDRLTSFFGQERLMELPEILDWKAIKAEYWAGHDNLEIKRKKQAECLVSEDISPELIHGFVCYDKRAEEILLHLGIPKAAIRVWPRAYF